MENSVVLDWKVFQVDLLKVRQYFKINLSSNYNGLICDENHLYVAFTEEYSSGDEDIVNAYWNSISSNSFNPTIQEIVTLKINNAIVFGESLIVQAAVENVLLGITQANKTKEVSDYLSNLQMYLRSGSLYAAITEINNLKNAGLPSELSPWVTTARLNAYITQIQAFLSS